MKKVSAIAVSLFAVFFVTSPAFSKEASDGMKHTYGTAGCGLGSMVFGNEPGAVQVFAATTNGTFGTQTFGITTGTSNCGKGLINASETSHLAQFVENNMDNLAKDIAKGNGESLNTLAELSGLTEAQKPAVFAKLQANFSNIFTSENVQVSEVVNQIVSIVKG
ncbi:MAG TPA: DUF3015 family protein [Nitrospiria bacterium]|nr:DUF3015 family protein [Nitrospiria bacterium]